MGVCNVFGSCHMQYFNIQRHGNRAPSLPWQLLQPKVYPLYHIVITWLACYTRHSKLQVYCVNWAAFITTFTLYMCSASNLTVCHLKLSNGLRCLPIFVNKCPQTSLYVTKWNKFSWTAVASNQCPSNIPRLSLILKLSVWTSHSNIRSDLCFQF